ncbi:MAG TPA: BTAD domain-containing putative transcriptional regulator [Natronosporangium sp.]
MQIALLGPLAVRDQAGTPVDVGGRRARTLLTLLALQPGQVVTSGYLIDRIWEADPPDGAQNALQALVSRLRRHLPDGVLESHRAGYRLAVEPDAVDVRRFERLVAEGSAALDADPQRALAALDEALALWRGPALAETVEAGFPPGEVMRLDELRLTAIENRAAAAIRLGDGQRVVPELEALLATHPTRERAAGLLIRALAAAGRSGDALAAYERIRTALADRLGADPSPELAELHRRLLHGDPQLVRAPAMPAEPPRTNLRAALTSFVGRDDDLARVGKLVTEYRLTTLIGPGGSGKTRLAVEASRSLVGELPDGVWLVELAPLTDGGEIAPAILNALGLRPQALLRRKRVSAAERWGRSLDALERHLDTGDDPVDRLTAALADRRLLLVLDNCEHLLDAVAALTDRLLGDCPRLRILTTSREPLGITGETLWPVEPLPMPPPGVTASQAASYPAVRLLAERAAAVRPGFAVDDGTVEDVVRICRALDGLPLAIELAAARLRTMTPRQLADRLADRFRVLTGGSRTALPRHQTLRAVVDWSWDLLSDPERRLLRRLAWFVGGATLEAVEQVCAGDDLPADQVLDLLTALVDKSLVGTCGGRHPRYELLETIREYGLARLAEAGEVDAVRRAHAGYFLRLATTAEPRLRTGDQLQWLARLGQDHENLVTAIRGAIDAGDAPVGFGLVSTLGWYWWLAGRKQEATELAAEVFTLPAEQVAPETRGVAYAMAALNAIEGPNDEARAIEWFVRATALAERADRQRHPLLRLVGPISQLLNSWAWGGDDAAPTADLYAGLTVLMDDPDPWVRATARMTRGHAALNGGWNHAVAERDLAAGLADYRTTGDRWGIAFMLSSLADLAAWRGEFAAAAGQLEQAKQLLAEFSTSEDLVTIQLRLAQLRWLLGDRAGADAELAAARQQADRMGLAKGRLDVEHLAGELARLTGELATARARLATAAERAATVPTPPHFRAVLASSRALLAGAEGDLEAARALHAEALREAILSGDAPVIARVVVGIADLALATGEPRLAARLLGASDAVRGTEDRSLPDAGRVAAAARAALGEPEFAEAYADGRASAPTSGEAVLALAAPLRLTPAA